MYVFKHVLIISFCFYHLCAASFAQTDEYAIDPSAPEAALLVVKEENFEDYNAQEKLSFFKNVWAKVLKTYDRTASPEIRETFTIIQEAIEEDVSEALPKAGVRLQFKALAKKLNLPSELTRVGIRAFHIYQIGQRSDRFQHAKDLIPDIITLTASTHLFEMTFVVWGPGLSASLGAPAWFTGSLTAIGAAMLIPGDLVGAPYLEPVCWAGRCAYFFSPRFRKFISVGSGLLRKIVFNPISTLSQPLQEHLMQRAKKRFLLSINQLQPFMQLSTFDQEFSLSFGLNSQLRLDFEKEVSSNSVVMQKLTINRQVNLGDKLQKQILSLFTGGARRVLKEVFLLEKQQRLDLLKEAYYTKAYNLTNNFAEIQLQPGAAMIPGDWMASAMPECEVYFVAADQ